MALDLGQAGLRFLERTSQLAYLALCVPCRFLAVDQLLLVLLGHLLQQLVLIILLISRLMFHLHH